MRKLNNIIKNPLSRKYAYINDDKNRLSKSKRDNLFGEMKK